MNRETLLQFVQRIILANTDGAQARLALEELASILKKQGVPETDLQLIRSAGEGVTDSADEMRGLVSASPSLSPKDLQAAVERAHARKLREEEERRNGRC